MTDRDIRAASDRIRAVDLRYKSDRPAAKIALSETMPYGRHNPPFGRNSRHKRRGTDATAGTAGKDGRVCRQTARASTTVEHVRSQVENLARIPHNR
ncbi:MAG TPA: hypothetical protein VGX78_05540, partial [Pirellulales bacterium]|nr:hypothetical protein [Pirellulales bacterium]